MTDRWEDDGGGQEVVVWVCVIHGKFVPCRSSNGLHLETDEDFWIRHVRAFQQDKHGSWKTWSEYLDNPDWTCLS